MTDVRVYGFSTPVLYQASVAARLYGLSVPALFQLSPTVRTYGFAISVLRSTNDKRAQQQSAILGGPTKWVKRM